MSSKGSIRALGIWKRFPVDQQRRLLRDQLGRVGDWIAGRRDRWRWVLRNVSVDVAPGESVGVVGINGSGKSTLLKILAQVMFPYAGHIEVSGRIAALIEIRAGIHPDLTGRENIFLYGSLLGLGRRQVARRFDEIVAFAELADAVDRQVKFFSSGMQMRLAFSVAALLEPDILLVDEVLAVGDAAFQRKCLERMEFLLSRGTTLVFVSHDLAMVEAICARALWLRDGVVDGTGPVRDVTSAYRRYIEGIAESRSTADGVVRLRETLVASVDGPEIRTRHALKISTVIDSDDTRTVAFCLGISEGTATPILVVRRDLSLHSGATRVGCILADLPLPRGRYFMWANVVDRAGHELLAWQPLLHFDVAGPDLDPPPRGIVRLAPIYVDAAWQRETL